MSKIYRQFQISTSRELLESIWYFVSLIPNDKWEQTELFTDDIASDLLQATIYNTDQDFYYTLAANMETQEAPEGHGKDYQILKYVPQSDHESGVAWTSQPSRKYVTIYSPGQSEFTDFYAESRIPVDSEKPLVLHLIGTENYIQGALQIDTDVWDYFFFGQLDIFSGMENGIACIGGPLAFPTNTPTAENTNYAHKVCLTGSNDFVNYASAYNEHDIHGIVQDDYGDWILIGNKRPNPDHDSTVSVLMHGMEPDDELSGTERIISPQFSIPENTIEFIRHKPVLFTPDDDDNYFPFASIPNIFHINMFNSYNGEYYKYRGNKYILFPIWSKDNGYSDSNKSGIALKLPKGA